LRVENLVSGPTARDKRGWRDKMKRNFFRCNLFACSHTQNLIDVYLKQEQCQINFLRECSPVAGVMRLLA